MRHHVPDLSGSRPVTNFCFRPFEEMCCLGHSSANSSIAIPGIGEPNYDTSGYRTNPNQDKKQQRKSDVRS